MLPMFGVITLITPKAVGVTGSRHPSKPRPSAALGQELPVAPLEAGVFVSTRFLAGERHGDRRSCRNIGRDRGRRRGFVRRVILRFRRTARSEGHWFRGDRGAGGEVLEAADVSGVRGSRNMGEIVSAEVGDGELAENVVEDRGRVLDPVVAPNEAGRLEAGEGEGVDVFLERHTVLQAERHGDRKFVHQRPEGGPFLVRVDKNGAVNLSGNRRDWRSGSAVCSCGDAQFGDLGSRQDRRHGVR